MKKKTDRVEVEKDNYGENSIDNHIGWVTCIFLTCLSVIRKKGMNPNCFESLLNKA